MVRVPSSGCRVLSVQVHKHDTPVFMRVYNKYLWPIVVGVLYVLCGAENVVKSCDFGLVSEMKIKTKRDK